MVALHKLEEVRAGFVLPSPPSLLIKVQDLCTAEEPDLAKLAELVACDIGLSAAILQAINSSAYGMNRQISDARQAVMFLGFKTVSGLVSSVLIQQAFVGKSAINFERFWDTSRQIAEAMVFIGQIIKDRVPLENLYTTGLFHDCGVAAMSIRFHDSYLQCLQEADKSDDQTLMEIEDARYNTSHPIVGYLIANGWNLPKEVCKVILGHHDPDSFDFGHDSIENLMMSTLKLAENIVERSSRDRDCVGWLEYKDTYFDQLGLMESDYFDLQEDLQQIWNEQAMGG